MNLGQCLWNQIWNYFFTHNRLSVSDAFSLGEIVWLVWVKGGERVFVHVYLFTVFAA